MFYGMAVINRIDIQEQKGFIKTCQNFAYCFQKLFWKKVKDFPKCVYYLTDMMNYLKIQNAWRSYLRNTDSVQNRGRYQYRKHDVRKVFISC